MENKEQTTEQEQAVAQRHQRARVHSWRYGSRSCGNSDANAFPLFTKAVQLLHCPSRHAHIKAKNACLYILQGLEAFFAGKRRKLLENVSKEKQKDADVNALARLSLTLSDEDRRVVRWFRRQCIVFFVDLCVLWRQSLSDLSAALQKRRLAV